MKSFSTQYLMKYFPTPVSHDILSYTSTSWNPFLPQHLMNYFPTTVPHEILSYHSTSWKPFLPSTSWNPFLPQYLMKSFPTTVPHKILSYPSTSWNPFLPQYLMKSIIATPPLYHPSSPPLLISFTTSTSSSPLQPKFKSSYSLVSISAWKTLLSGSSYFILTTFYSNPCRLTPPLLLPFLSFPSPTSPFTQSPLLFSWGW